MNMNQLVLSLPVPSFYRVISDKSSFIVSVNGISSFTFLIFSRLQFHCFFFLGFFFYKFNEYESISSLIASAFFCV